MASFRWRFPTRRHSGAGGAPALLALALCAVGAVGARRMPPRSAPATAAQPPRSAGNAAAARFQRQLDRIQVQSRRGPFHTITLSAADANAWFAGPGAAVLPRAVSHFQCGARPDTIAGEADIDFDRLPAHGLNALLAAMFSGTHHVAAVAQLDGVSGGYAHLTVTSVAIDGQTIPNLAVDAAIRAFIQPKHPEIGRTFAVKLPANATGAQIRDGAVLLLYGR